MLNKNLGIGFLFLISILISACTKSESKKPDTNPAVLLPAVPKEDSPEAPIPAPAPIPGGASEVLQLQKSCVQSVCGNDPVFQHRHSLDVQQRLNDYQLINQELKRPLQLFMGQLIHRHLLIDRGYKEVFKDIKNDPKRLQLSKEAQSILKGIQLLEDGGKFIAAIDWKSPGVPLTSEKMKQIDPNITDLEIEAYQKLIGILVTKWFANSSNDERYFKNLHFFTTTPMQAMQAEATLLTSLVENIRKNIPEANIFLEDTVFARVQSGQVISKSEMAHFRKQSEYIRTIAFLSETNLLNILAKLDYNLQAASEQAMNLYKVGKKGEIFSDKTKIKRELIYATVYCSSLMNYAYGALPSKKQLDDFQKGVDLIKTTGLAMSEQRGVAQSLLNEVNSTLKVVLPQDRDQAILDWKESFEIENNFEKINRNYLKEMGLNSKLTGDEKDLNLSSTSKAKLLFDLILNNKRTEVFEEAMAICRKAAPEYLHDHASGSAFEKYIELSWPTVTVPKVGYSIFAHEFGHVLAMSIPGFASDAKACLEKAQGTPQYLEEDFADLFATEIGLELKQDVQGVKLSNMACGLIENEKSDWKVNGGLVNPNPNDPHSSGFYRMIAIASASSSITPQCQNSLDSVKETRFGSYCRW